MNFKKLKEEELKTIFPNSGTIDLQTMNEKEKKQYVLVYNLYRKIFTKYIIDTLELKKYDNELRNSKLNFKSIDEENMDIYQYFSSNELKFFYIRNNIYIDRLNEQEIKFLINKTKDNNLELDEEIKNFVEHTYEKLIFEDVGKDGKKYITFYGPNSSNYAAENDSLVLGMRYNEFDLNGLDDDSWDELNIEQNMYLPDVFYKLVSEQKDKVSIPIEVLQYNDFSVKRRSLGNKSKEKDEEEER